MQEAGRQGTPEKLVPNTAATPPLAPQRSADPAMPNIAGARPKAAAAPPAGRMRVAEPSKLMQGPEALANRSFVAQVRSGSSFHVHAQLMMSVEGLVEVRWACLG